LRTNKEVSTHGSCWIFAIEKKLIQAAVNDEDLKIRKSINGGTLGLEEVERLTKLAEQLIK
jgi:predicted chitinase